GLSKQLEPILAYIEPQCYKVSNYAIDKKSDIYSLGVLLWEITSGYPPFSKIPVITDEVRERPIIDTPSAYVNLYQKCWDDDPNLRPTIDDVFDTLEKFSLQSDDNSKITEDLKSDFINPNLINQNDSQSLALTNQISKYLLTYLLIV